MTFQPTSEQQDAIALFRSGANMAIEAGAGTGKTSTLALLAQASGGRKGQYIAFNKALRADQPVATPDGWREIGALSVGDEVFGPDGKAHHVTKVIDRGMRPMYRVRFSDGTEVVADGEHLWEVERTHSANTAYVHNIVATTEEVAAHLALRRRVRVPQQQALDLPQADLLVDPWLLGVLLGDGNLMNGRAAVTNLDDWMFDEIRRRLPDGCSMRFVATPGRRARTAAVVGDGRRNPLIDRLRLLGIYGLVASTKSVPDDYLWASAPQRLALLRGLMDTDGSVGALAVTPIFCSTSEALTDAVVFLTQSLGGTASKRVMRVAVGPWQKAYQVTVRLPAGMVPFARPSRVHALRPRSHDRLLRRRFISIEPAASARAVCIAIDSADKLFLTAGLVPTHNSIVTEAGERFPGSVNCATAHSLAFRAVGRGYAHRLKTPRMKSMDIARLLRIDPLVIRYGSQSKPLAAGYLAGLVMRSVIKFCQTADPEPAERHVPYIDGIDVPASDGRRTYANNDVVRAHVMPAVRRAWADLCDRNGQLVFRHDHYLKIFQLSDPYIDADFILFDEAQDASPVLLDIVLRQTHAQLVFVGDSAQAIYGFTGAVDALDRIRETGASTCFLTRSFRFGPAVADVANNLLERLGAELRLTGSPDVASVVAAVPEPDCILTRTNATSVQIVLEQLAAGRKVALVGGGREVLDFARAADDLKNGRWTSHPELACFQTWGDVQSYVEQDVQGGELRLLVNLVDEFGVEKIVAALGHNCVESDADVVVSTAHKCVHPGTLVETVDGLMPIAAIPPVGTIATPFGMGRYGEKFWRAEAAALKITTRAGFEVTVTPEHGMTVWDPTGGAHVRRPASALRDGDLLRIRIGRSGPGPRTPVALPGPVGGDPRERVYSTPPLLDETAAEFLGLMVADGTVWQRGFRVAKRYRSVTERFSDLCLKLFGRAATLGEHMDTPMAEMHSSFLARWLRSVGGLAPNHKAIPDAVLRSPWAVQAAFLRGLFEDGTVNEYDGFVDHIHWENRDASLAATVQVMLLAQEIVAVRTARPSQKGISSLALYGQNARLFAERIGFVADEKNARCVNARYAEQRRYSIPVSKAEVERLHLAKFDRQNARAKGRVTRHVLAHADGLAGAPDLADRLNWHYDPIVALEPVRCESMCVSVPAGERFLQNGFDGWNSKGREWGSVQIAGDFKAPKDGSELDDEELRLLYVACTRARRELDVTLAPHATESPEEDIDDVPLPGFAVADDLSALEMTARYGTRQAPPA